MTRQSQTRNATPPRPEDAPDGGFSLVELMVVILIMGLLSSVVLFSVVPQLQRSKTEVAKVQVGRIDQALSLYYLQEGRFPSAQEGLAALSARGADGNSYISEVPADPWNRPYEYRVQGARSGKGYDVFSVGEDGQSGTEDDIGNWS